MFKTVPCSKVLCQSASGFGFLHHSTDLDEPDKHVTSVFTERCFASAVLAMAIPSVCPSVRLSVRRPSHAGIVSKRRHVARCSLYVG